MADSKRKRVQKSGDGDNCEAENEDSPNDSIGSVENEEEVNEEIQVDFEAHNLTDSDYFGIRKLLQQSFLKANVDLSELTNILISQNYVGSVIKQADDVDDEGDEDEMETDEADVFGVISVVSLLQHQNSACIQQIKNLIISKCSGINAEAGAKLAEILNDSSNHVGFVISERFVNIPPQIAVPSYDALWKEVSEAKKAMNFNFTHLLFISKILKMRPVKKSKKKSAQTSNSKPTFLNAEEELYKEAAVFVGEYSVAEDRDTVVVDQWDDEDDELLPFRMVIVVPTVHLDQVMQRMRELFAIV